MRRIFVLALARIQRVIAPAILLFSPFTYLLVILINNDYPQFLNRQKMGDDDDEPIGGAIGVCFDAQIYEIDEARAPSPVAEFGNFSAEPPPRGTRPSRFPTWVFLITSIQLCMLVATSSTLSAVRRRKSLIRFSLPRFSSTANRIAAQTYFLSPRQLDPTATTLL